MKLKKSNLHKEYLHKKLRIYFNILKNKNKRKKN
jgi:hypothetical protein